MNTTIAERQKEQTGLDEPTHQQSVFPEQKTITQTYEQEISICTRCGYVWQRGAMISHVCPTCGYTFIIFPPTRK